MIGVPISIVSSEPVITPEENVFHSKPAMARIITINRRSTAGTQEETKEANNFLSIKYFKQVEKNGNQINKITMMIQSMRKQKQTKSTEGAGVSQSPPQSIKQIQSQVSQLQKQVTRIHNNIQRIRTTSGIGTRAKFKKLAPSSANIKPRPKSKSLNTKARRGRKSR
jgi:ssDNA-specific exonuclease RecJ